MISYHLAEEESGFSSKICGLVDSLGQAIPRALPRKDAFSEAASRPYWESLRREVERLWPELVRPQFKDVPEALAYQMAWIAAGYSPYSDCLRASALLDARKRGDKALSEAVKLADAVPRPDAPPPSLLLREVEKGPHNPYLDCEFISGKAYSNVEAVQTCRRLGGLISEARAAGRKSISTWDVFGALPKTRPRLSYRWISKCLLSFAKGCDEYGVKIRRVSAAFVLFLGRDASRALLAPEVSSRFLLTFGKALPAPVDDRPGTTPLGQLFRLLSGWGGKDFACGRIFEISDVFLRAFSDGWGSLRRLKKDAAYLRFLSTVLDEPRGRDYATSVSKDLLSSSPKGAALWRHLFGAHLPLWAQSGRADFLTSLSKNTAGLALDSGDNRRILLSVTSVRQKERLLKSGIWLSIFSADDGFKKSMLGWRFVFLLRDRSRETARVAYDRLSLEKDSSAYLRFAVYHLPENKRSLHWLTKTIDWSGELEKRFIFDFHGSALWEEAGGVKLERDPQEVQCYAWGSATFQGREESLASALKSALLDDNGHFVELMLTPTGLKRCGGALLRILPRLSFKVADQIVHSRKSPQEAIETLALKGGPAIRARAIREAYDRFGTEEAITLVEKLFFNDSLFEESLEYFDYPGGTRYGLFVSLCIASREKNPDRICQEIYTFINKNFADEKEQAVIIRDALAEVARLVARKGERLSAAELGLLAAIWPGKETRLVKWLVSAMDWKAQPGRRLQKAYRRFYIPKKHGGRRLISEPKEPLKWLQRAVLDRLIAPLGAHPAAMGFVEGRSIADNAAVHVGQKLVAVADVRNCFPSVAWPVLYRVLERDFAEKLGAPACALIADLCTLDGGLPMGSPASPALLNRVLFKADEILASEAQRKGCRYTRYADDLTFSGGEEAVGLIARAGSVLSAAGLRLDPKKSSVFRRGRRQVVTGLTVNAKPDVSRDYRRRVRAAADRWRKGLEPSWQGRPMTREQLLGRIAFVHMTSPEEAARLLKWVREGDRRRGKRKKGSAK